MSEIDDEREFQQSRILAKRHGYILFRVESGVYTIVPKNSRRRWYGVQYRSGEAPIGLGDCHINPGKNHAKTLFSFVQWFLRQKGIDLGRLSKRQQLLKIISDD